jgi:hypothetical protein
MLAGESDFVGFLRSESTHELDDLSFLDRRPNETYRTTISRFPTRPPGVGPSKDMGPAETATTSVKAENTICEKRIGLAS